MKPLPMPLYHGTSTLFLNDILKAGLGGINPIQAWKVLEFSEKLLPYVEEHIGSDNYLYARVQSFGRMVNQESGPMNFQHGDTYVTASEGAAVRYAANKRYGSELLTYVMDFLNELVRKNLPGITRDLFGQYPKIFSLLDISPAPLIVELRGCGPDWLRTESNDSAEGQINDLLKHWATDKELFNVLGQQMNFRLTRAVPISNQKIWFLNILRWNQFAPDYQKFLIDPKRSTRVTGA